MDTNTDIKVETIINPIKWAEYTKIIVASEEPAIKLFQSANCTIEEAEQLAFENLICFSIQNKLTPSQFASLLYSLTENNVSYKFVYDDNNDSTKDKEATAIQKTETYYLSELQANGNGTSICNKIDYSNTDAIHANKKVSLFGFFFTLGVMWFLFWKGTGSYWEFFDPTYSLFESFIDDVTNFRWKTREMISWIAAIVSIPFAWIIRSVVGMGILSLLALLYKKA